MPNWCTNELQVSGSVEAMDKWRSVLVEDETFEPILVFNKLIPMPKEYETDERWYDWRIQNWGVKWDIDGDDSQPYNYDSVTAEYSFQTPWGPPIELFENITKNFPGITFSLAYYEEGMQFAGHIKILDGEVIHKESHEGKAFAQFVYDYFGDDFYLDDEAWNEEEE